MAAPARRDGYFSRRCRTGRTATSASPAASTGGLRQHRRRHQQPYVAASFTVSRRTAADDAPWPDVPGRDVRDERHRRSLSGPVVNSIDVTLDWDDNNNQHQFPPGTNCGGNRCEYNGTQSVHAHSSAPTATRSHSPRIEAPSTLVRTSRDPSQTYVGRAAGRSRGHPVRERGSRARSGIRPRRSRSIPSVGPQTPLKTGRPRDPALRRQPGTGLAATATRTTRTGHDVPGVPDGLQPVVHATTSSQARRGGSRPPTGPARHLVQLHTNGSRPSEPNGPDNAVAMRPQGVRAFKTATVIGDWISGAIGNCRIHQQQLCQQHRLHQPELLRPGQTRIGWALVGRRRAQPARGHTCSSSRTALQDHTARRTVSRSSTSPPSIVTGWRGVNGNPATTPAPRATRPDNGPAPPAPHEPVPKPGEIVGYFVEQDDAERARQPERRVPRVGQLRPWSLYSFVSSADRDNPQTADSREEHPRVEHVTHHQGHAVAGLDARSRHRRGRARRDPADRLPRPVPLERQRVDRGHARARREGPDPEGHVRNGHRREGALPGGDAPEGRPQDRRRSPIRRTSTAASRSRTSSPASRSRRPTSARAHGRDPDAADRASSAPLPSRSARRRASSDTSRAATASTSTTRSPAAAERARAPRAERADHAGRHPDDHPRRCSARAEARARLRVGDAVVPAPARGQRKAPPKRSDLEHGPPAADHEPAEDRRGSRRRGSHDPRSRRRRRARCLRRAAQPARRRELPAPGDNRGRRRDGPGAPGAALRTSSSSPARAARTTGRCRSSTAPIAPLPTCRSSSSRPPRRTGSSGGRSRSARPTWRSSRSRRSSSGSR